MTSSAREIAHS